VAFDKGHVRHCVLFASQLKENAGTAEAICSVPGGAGSTGIRQKIGNKRETFADKIRARRRRTESRASGRAERFENEETQNRFKKLLRGESRDS